MASSENGQTMMAFILEDKRNHTDNDYGYCDECRGPWHDERDDADVTDWFGRVAGKAGESGPATSPPSA